MIEKINQKPNRSFQPRELMRKKKGKPNPVRELTRLIKPGQVLKKKHIDRVTKRICGSLLTGTPEAQVNKIEKIATSISPLARQGDDYYLLAMALFYELTDQLLRQNRLILFLRVYANGMGDFSDIPGRGDSSSNDGAPEEEELGRFLFTSSFFSRIGEDAGRSIQFALFLMEEFSRHREDTLAGVEFTGSEDDILMAALNQLIICSVTEMPGKDVKERRWFARLLRSLDADPVIQEILDAVFDIFSYCSKASGSSGEYEVRCHDHALEIDWEEHLNDADFWRVELEHRQNPPEDSRHGMSMADIIRAAVVNLTKKEYEAYLRWEAKQETIDRDRDEASTRVIDWFTSRAAVIQGALAKKRNEIHTKTRRGLRANGADHIDIHIQPLRNAGVHSIVLHPEGCDFPDVKLTLTMRDITPHLITRTGLELRQLQLHVPDGFVLSGDEEHNRHCEALLEYIIIDILHRLMVESREFRTRKPRRLHDSGEVIELTKRITPVRPHIQRLQPGHKASDRAKQGAKKAWGWNNLPSGKTFVRAHHRGTGLSYELPTEPVAIYTRDDLLRSLPEHE